MYRRSTITQNQQTPKFGTKYGKVNLAALHSSSTDFHRSVSVANISRPSTVSGSRSSSVGPCSTGKRNCGRPSMPLASSGMPQLTKDPRPIADKCYQAEMVKRLVAFLRERGRMDLTEQQLRTPTRQVIFTVFSALYRFINEDYHGSEQSFKVDFPQLLRLIGYQFPPSLSILKTPNAPHAWPSVLAALSWLREIVEFGLKFSFEQALFPASENDFLSNPVRSGGETQSYAIYEYYCQCYMHQKAGNDDYKAFEQRLGDVLDFGGRDANLEQMRLENVGLKKELAMLESQLARKSELEKAIRDMKDDASKMDDYLQRMDGYMRVRGQELKQMQQQQREIEGLIAEIKIEIEDKEGVVAKQGVKPEEVQRMAAKEAHIKKRIVALRSEKRKLESISLEYEKTIAAKKDAVEAKANKFNKAAKALVRAMPSLRTLEIAPFQPNFVERVKKNIWPWINNVKKFVLKDMEKLEMNIADSKAQISELETQIIELEAEYGLLESKLKQWESDLEKYRKEKYTEYQQFLKGLDSLQREYDSISRESALAKEERELKKKEQEDLCKTLGEKCKLHKEVDAQWDRELLETAQKARQHVVELEQMKADAIERLRAVRDELEKME